MRFMFNLRELAEAYENFDGPVVEAPMARPRPTEITFRNNRYSIFNMGRQASILGGRGFSAEVDRV
jgi:hypothetical protein